LDANQNYPLDIEIIDQASQCLVDTGLITIWDYIGDKEKTPIRIPIQNGHAQYLEIPGVPNTADGGDNPFQKIFYLEAEAGVRDPAVSESWIFLKGTKELTPTFTSRSPEFPDLIVHDPPGDNSYAWVEEGSSYTSFTNTQYEISGSGGAYADALIGSKLNSFVGLGAGVEQTVGVGLKVTTEVQAGKNNFDKTTYASTYAFDETFSTSSDPLFTGHEGDVYIGKAVNQLFSIAKVLDFDEATCIASVKDLPNLQPGLVATTFIYSEKHIKNVLIPQLEYLAKTIRDQASKETDPQTQEDLIREAILFDRDTLAWNGILDKNADNRDNEAVYVRNQSFAAGATYQSVQSYDEKSGGSYEYTEFVDAELNIGNAWVVEAGVWSEGSAGYATKLRHSYTKDEGDNSTNTFKVGYELADKDIGDFFSVDILTDTAFNVPAFRLFGGTSSCPHEEGTEPRDVADITSIVPPKRDNVPTGGIATFTVNLVNDSESQEAREYQVRVIPQTNPDGAIITMGGQNITNKSISYFLEYGNTLPVTMTVEAGPLATNYENIGIMMYPPCEYELWENNGNLTNGDTAYITVNFESECTPVALSHPADNWLVNANSDNTLQVDFTGYDLNNPYFKSLTLQYQLQNQSWKDATTIYKPKNVKDGIFTPLDSLEGASFRKFWMLDTLAEGVYKIRAQANCEVESKEVKTYSSSLNGLIDRNSIAPFGIPTPSDGFLRLGQVISVQFDTDIDCGFTDLNPTYTPTITLTRTDNNTLIPINIQCRAQDDQINLIPTVDIFSMPELEDVILVASVQGIHDAQGNVQVYPVEWAFKVNASPVNWDPDSMNVALAAGRSHVINSKLKNTAVLGKAFTIDAYPAWLTPSILSGIVLSDAEYEIGFLVDPELPVGIYRDTVVAMVDGWPEYLDITYQAVAVPPNWKVNPSQYDYSMNMVLALSLDQTDTNLSRDGNDRVAAIYNGEIRGVAQLEYVAQFNKYMAFLTVYSDIPANEEITFSMWRAATGVEHRAKETFFFQHEKITGRLGDPEILHTDGIYQVIPLTQGWNWVSLNITNADMTIPNLLNSLASPEVGNDIVVKRKDDRTATFTQIATPIIFANQWAGTGFAELDNRRMYMIHLSDAPDTLRVPGYPIANFDNIDVSSGWNWIGYQPQGAQALKDGLGSVNLRNRDLLIGQEGFSEYHKGSKTWYGPLQFMEPGKGYKLKLKVGVTYNNLVYSRVGLKDFEVDYQKYESNMTLIASVGLEVGDVSQEIIEERLLVGAFIDDTCRGYGYVEYVPFLDDYRVIFSLQGNPSDIGRPLTFRIYDTQSGQEFIPDNEPEIYITDRILGGMIEPYVLFNRLELPEAGYFLEQNYPNPYDEKTSIRFILPQEDQVKLTVFDSFGKIVKVLIDEELTAGEHTAVFEAAALPSGVYHYTIQAGEYRASRKMVKF